MATAQERHPGKTSSAECVGTPGTWRVSAALCRVPWAGREWGGDPCAHRGRAPAGAVVRAGSWWLGGARPQSEPQLCWLLSPPPAPGMRPEKPHLCSGVHALRWPRIPGDEPCTQPRNGRGGPQSAVQLHRAWVRRWHGRGEAPGWTSTCPSTGMPSSPGMVSSASGGRLSTQRPSPASWGWRPRSARHVRCPEPSVGSCSRPGGHDLPSLPGKHSREAMVSESACPKWLLSFSTYLFYCWPWKHTEGFGWVKNSGWKLFPFWLRRGISVSFACRSCCWETQNLVGSTLWANFPTSKITARSLLYCPAPCEEPWRGLLFIPVLDIHRALLIPQPTPFISEKCPCFLLL